MVQVASIDSNVTGLRYAEEESYKTLPVTPTWIVQEPNSYSAFGAQIATVARNPINPSRQRKKGVTTDLDAAAGYQFDLTQTNFQDLGQGFFFADLRRKGEENPNTVTVQAGDDTYDVTDSTGFAIGDIILASGFGEDANNGIKNVTGIDTVGTDVAVAETLVDEGSPPADAQIVVVGRTAATADIDVDATGLFPAYTSSVLDFTTLGLIVGEFIFVGGDAGSSVFVNAANNGIKRVRSIAANRLEVDKSNETMVTETGTGLDIEFYFGRVLRNELGTLVKRRTYQLERTLGAPDSDFPTQIQAEYIVGAVPNEATLNIPSADKITVDVTFVGADAEYIDGPTSLKSGDRPAGIESDAFNTSSDVKRSKLAIFTDGNEAPTPLFAFAQEFTIALSNNVSPNKAVGTLGAFEVTAGTFQVSGSLTAYFANLDAVQAVRDNEDITIDYFLVKGASGEKAGISIDLPLVTLGDGRLNVEQDQPITLPLTQDAASASKIDTNLDYTLQLVFFDYLPNAADT